MVGYADFLLHHSLGCSFRCSTAPLTMEWKSGTFRAAQNRERSTTSWRWTSGAHPCCCVRAAPPRSRHRFFSRATSIDATPPPPPFELPRHFHLKLPLRPSSGYRLGCGDRIPADHPASAARWISTPEMRPVTPSLPRLSELSPLALYSGAFRKREYASRKARILSRRGRPRTSLRHERWGRFRHVWLSALLCLDAFSATVLPPLEMRSRSIADFGDRRFLAMATPPYCAEASRGLPPVGGVFR